MNPFVTRESARLSKGGLTEIALIGPDVGVPPVVHNQACAFCEESVATPVLADEMHYHFFSLFV